MLCYANVCSPHRTALAWLRAGGQYPQSGCLRGPTRAYGSRADHLKGTCRLPGSIVGVSGSRTIRDP